MADGIQTLPVIEIQAQAVSGVSMAASAGRVSAAELAHRPLSRPGEALETVPGLVVTQHSGNGKANQFFLRGFNLDHGTDFAVSLDGMPLNLPTHGHGQGYADVNFLIPELIAAIDFRKGPYYAEQGDFSAAGAADVRYAEKLVSQRLEIAGGEYGYRRALVAGSPALAGGRLLYALEVQQNDGPWDLPEDLDKVNGVLRYSAGDAQNGWNATLMSYRNRWRSTDQIPLRAVESGLIGRFGNIDPSDGGNTHRHSLSAAWRSTGEHHRSRANVYAVDYRMRLFSNFTYFLDDPVNGDQFEQFDDRRIFGAAASHAWIVGGIEHSVGLQARHDAIDTVGLYKTAVRNRLGTVREDTVDQTSLALWYQAELPITERLRLIPGLRGDAYRFDVDSDRVQNSGSLDDTIVSPKLSAVYTLTRSTELYANAGRGFHSNDARGATIRVDPTDGVTPVDRVDPLVAARGYELGVRFQPRPELRNELALFRLDLDSELLFVGDAGGTEATRPSRRVGLEWSGHWHPYRWLAFDYDVTVTRARFRDDDPAGDRIPGAVERTASLGVVYDHQYWFAGARLRHFGARPLIEDDSVHSRATTLVNMEVGRRFGKQVEIALSALNLFDRKHADIDYFYESQLAGELAPVADIHTHPVEPRTLRLALRVRF